LLPPAANGGGRQAGKNWGSLRGKFFARLIDDEPKNFEYGFLKKSGNKSEKINLILKSLRNFGKLKQ